MTGMKFNVAGAAAREYGQANPMASSLVIAVIVAVVARILWRSRSNGPPMLPETIPYVSNTYQYMTDMRTFLSRAACVTLPIR